MQSLLVGIAIPGSFLSGILALSLMGFTVNIVVLFAILIRVLVGFGGYSGLLLVSNF